jgi:hypothetical protein
MVELTMATKEARRILAAPCSLAGSKVSPGFPAGWLGLRAEGGEVVFLASSSDRAATLAVRVPAKVEEPGEGWVSAAALQRSLGVSDAESFPVVVDDDGTVHLGGVLHHPGITVPLPDVPEVGADEGVVVQTELLAAALRAAAQVKEAVAQAPSVQLYLTEGGLTIVTVSHYLAIREVVPVEGDVHAPAFAALPRMRAKGVVALARRLLGQKARVALRNGHFVAVGDEAAVSLQGLSEKPMEAQVAPLFEGDVEGRLVIAGERLSRWAELATQLGAHLELEAGSQGCLARTSGVGIAGLAGAHLDAVVDGSATEGVWVAKASTTPLRAAIRALGSTAGSPKGGDEADPEEDTDEDEVPVAPAGAMTVTVIAQEAGRPPRLLLAAGGATGRQAVMASSQ